MRVVQSSMSEYEHHVRRDNAAAGAEWHCGCNVTSKSSILEMDAKLLLQCQRAPVRAAAAADIIKRGSFQIHPIHKKAYTNVYMNFSLWGPLARLVCEGVAKTRSSPAFPRARGLRPGQNDSESQRSEMPCVSVADSPLMMLY